MSIMYLISFIYMDADVCLTHRGIRGIGLFTEDLEAMQSTAVPCRAS
jgi:DUF2075 family protein